MLNIDEFGEGVGELIIAWNELLNIATAFTYDEEELDQELFRDTMFKTWRLFSERIDFDAEYSDYNLPIGMAYILGHMMVYSKKTQVEVRQDGGEIELSAGIVNALVSQIIKRKNFPRNVPVVDYRMKIDGSVAKLAYNCETGVLRVSDKSGKVMEITDISHWWDVE